ncbi:MAG: hypothetical protein JRH20_13035 [Deltaproteobacteria bacterium]|nr:hypothetical protein [Deltaproteobacteria bacterium]
MRVPSFLLVLLFGGCQVIAGYDTAVSPDASAEDAYVLEGGTGYDGVADRMRVDSLSLVDSTLITDSAPSADSTLITDSATSADNATSADSAPSADSTLITDSATSADSGATAPEGYALLFSLRTVSGESGSNPFAVTIAKTGNILWWDLVTETHFGNSVSKSYASGSEKKVRAFSNDGATGVTRVMCYGNSLIGDVPNFSQLSNLQILSLYSNRLTGIPPTALSALSRLRELELDRNMFITSSPGAFSGLKAIEWIDLRNNQLEETALNNIINDIYQDRGLHTSNRKSLYLNMGNAIPGADACAQVKVLRNPPYNWYLYTEGC